MDQRLAVAVVVAASSAYLFIVITRKLLEAINKASGGKFYANTWVKTAGIFLDTLLPVLPCVPSGLLAILIMNYWPPDVLWKNNLLYFCIGALAGSVAAQIYYLVTRAITKRVAAAAADSKTPDPPKDDPAS